MNSLFGPLDDVAGDAGHVEHPPRVGFFTDTSVCIGCKACEVACKQWNAVPAAEQLDLLGMSHDNTGALGANAWRHVAFVEQRQAWSTWACRAPGRRGHGLRRLRWLMASDVCKHCTHAGCLDVCPTGALFRTEFGSVVVQQDICNGCGYCVSACPYGVIERRPGDGRAQKCTLCYDRLHGGLEPACAKACPTDSIQFGELDELRERAAARVAALHERGVHRGPALRRTTRTTASAATARSSCCSTSRRSTGCRPTRSCRPATPCAMWRLRRGGRRARSSPRPWARSGVGGRR